MILSQIAGTTHSALLGTFLYLTEFALASDCPHLVWILPFLQLSTPQRHDHFQSRTPLPIAPVSCTCHLTTSLKARPASFFLRKFTEVATQESRRVNQTIEPFTSSLAWSFLVPLRWHRRKVWETLTPIFFWATLVGASYSLLNCVLFYESYVELSNALLAVNTEIHFVEVKPSAWGHFIH